MGGKSLDDYYSQSTLQFWKAFSHIFLIDPHYVGNSGTGKYSDS